MTRTRARRGVTLVELLIAMVVVSVLAAAMTKLMVANSRAAEVVAAERDARGVSRASINLLESELRMVDPRGIVTPTDSARLTVNEPYAWGLVCGTSGGSTVIATLPSFEFPANYETPGHAGWAWRDNTTSQYVYETGTMIASGTASVCTTTKISNFIGNGGYVIAVPASASTVAPGTVAFLYRRIQYSLASSTTYPGRIGLFRKAGANGTPEELAAPFSSGSRFRYYLRNDLLPGDSIPTFLDDIRGVQFRLNGESVRQARASTDVARAPFVTAVFFQNRPS